MFKIGDKVRYVGQDCPEFTQGATYTVGGIYFDRDEDVGVISDDNGKMNGHRPDRFELVTHVPIREVTRREIVPGRYGRVHISEKLMVRVDAIRTVEELDEAVHILNQVREVMVDG